MKLPASFFGVYNNITDCGTVSLHACSYIKGFEMAQRRTNTYNVGIPEDIYDEVELPDYQAEKKDLGARSGRANVSTLLQENSSVQPTAINKKPPKQLFSKKKNILIWAVALLLLLLLLVIIVLASVAVNLLNTTQDNKIQCTYLM